MSVKWIFSNEVTQWKEKTVKISKEEVPTLWLDGNKYQEMKGFGACFNELGYEALQYLPIESQEKLLKDLFGNNEDECNFNLCRLPIGANDYAKDWYSLNEVAGDYDMSHFSIKRDEKYIIPYVKRAMNYQKELILFASPWSPPTWMKSPPVYNSGKLIMTKENLRAYAKYFSNYVKAYADKKIHIDQVHIQNEPVADQQFPSCMWSGEELKIFIKDYLGPRFEKEKLDTEIWLGTINAPGGDYLRLIFDKCATEDYDYFANEVLSNKKALQYITGVSYQWGGKAAIQRTFESWWPQIRLMQSENECGFGDNTWEYAFYNWTMLKHYISNGAESYMYWNFMLKPNGVSTWGDPQNSMITIDPDTKLYTYNPDYYIMKHFSSTVMRNAVLLGAKGPSAGDTVIFKNPDNSIVINAFNPFKKKHKLIAKFTGASYVFEMEPRSVNSIVIPPIKEK